MTEHDIFLNTNVVDNTPVSVLEAAASGLVPVATAVGGVPKLLTDDVDSLLVASGDDEAMALDEEFLAAMEHGMPPTTGTGMGIDRLLMALTGLGIRETILFPIVRPTAR